MRGYEAEAAGEDGGETPATELPGAGRVAVRVRPLATQEEYAECHRLQYRTWGPGYRDAVPPSLLKVSQKVGGLVAGAFAESGEMLGFVYGLSGLERGRGVHWSHMLAVDPAHRDRGIGRRLKLFQRDYLRRLGVEVLYWTFDPLVARNAHLNVNRLGVRLVEYAPDMYPDTGSDLHTFGTDRFVAEWVVNGPLTARLPQADPVMRSSPVANAGASRPGILGRAAVVRVEIPVDAESMRTGELAELRQWRSSSREAFLQLLRRGFAVTGFYRENGRCYYVLTEGSG